VSDGEPEFALLPLELLRGHEEHDEEKVDELVAELQRTGLFVDPIWVARGSWVILNGHHRVEALRRLGLKRIPAWVFDYHSDRVDVDRWSPVPPIGKDEVVRRAHEGPRFPPKTTRHRLRVELPRRTVPLSELAN
jgi:L-serine kinase (ADP)